MHRCFQTFFIEYWILNDIPSQWTNSIKFLSMSSLNLVSLDLTASYTPLLLPLFWLKLVLSLLCFCSLTAFNLSITYTAFSFFAYCNLCLHAINKFKGFYTCYRWHCGIIENCSAVLVPRTLCDWGLCCGRWMVGSYTSERTVYSWQ